MTIASDNFNRADGALGANWATCAVNSWVVSGNRAVPGTAGAFNMMRYTGGSFANDQECQCIPQPIGGFFPAPAVRLDASGNGYAAMVDSASNGWRLARIDAGSNDDLTTGPETFNGTSDVLKIRAVGSTISIYKNGVLLASVTEATYASGAPGLWSFESNGSVDDWSATDAFGSATVTPSPAALTLSGKIPATSAFQNVRIRDVLVNGSGQAVGNATDIGLRVWYSGVCAGAPDVSLNGMMTDAAGTASWSIATGTLAYGQTIFYVAQNSVSYSHYACGRLVPNYE